MFKITNGRPHFYQWDLNQKISVPANCAETHWAYAPGYRRNNEDNALVLVPYEIDGTLVVDVPNVLLQTAGFITAYCYIETETEGYTKCDKTFLVKPREKPADYVYTETEVQSYKDLEERIAYIENHGGSGGIDVLTKFDGVDTDYEESQVYNANAVNQGFTMCAEAIEEIQSTLDALGDDYQQALKLIGGAE